MKTSTFIGKVIGYRKVLNEDTGKLEGALVVVTDHLTDDELIELVFAGVKVQICPSD